jgi:cell division protein FtsW (lipid II flippase)
MKHKELRDAGRLVSMSALFFASAFILIALKTTPPDWTALALAAVIPSVLWFVVITLPKFLPGDRLILALTHFLCAFGILVLYSVDPPKGLQQAYYYAIGIPVMFAAAFIIKGIGSRWKWLVFILFPVSLGLLLLPLVIGKEIHGARNWIVVAGMSVQPSEVVKLSLLLILSYYMGRRRMLPWLLFSLGCLSLLALQKDLGTALMYYATALLMYYVSSGNIPITALGALGGSGAAVLAYHLPAFAHVRLRVAIWQNPWRDIEGAGYQIVQALMAIASGGLWGVGLKLGTPTIIPVYESDMIFAVICEQFGILFGLCVLLVYAALVCRGIMIAMAARTRFHSLLAIGCAALLGIQTFVIVGGVIKLIPLTGVTMPFISAGGTSLVSSLCLMGMLQGIASLNEEAMREDARLSMLGAQNGELWL